MLVEVSSAEQSPDTLTNHKKVGEQHISSSDRLKLLSYHFHKACKSSNSPHRTQL